MLEALKTVFSETHPVEELIPLLQKEIALWANDDTRIFERELGVIHPSGIGGKCERQLLYSTIGAPHDGGNTARGQMIFAYGHSVHDRLQGFMQKLADRFPGKIRNWGTEIPFSNTELIIRGHADQLMQFGEYTVLIEYKSCNSKTFKALTWPSDKYVEQVQAYFMSTPAPMEDGTPRPRPNVGLIIYENKDTQELTHFFLTPNDKVGTIVMRKALAIKALLDKRELGVRLCRGQTDYEAKWCPYVMSCFDERLDFGKMDRRHLQKEKKS